MGALSWLSVLLGTIITVLFIYWTFRAERMNVKTLRNFFVGGIVVFGILFLIFTADTLSVLPKRTNADKLTTEVVEGKKAWQRYVCIDCHTILGNGAYYGPDLTKAYKRFLARADGDEGVAEQALFTFLKNPPASTSSRRGMPNFAMADETAKNLGAFLKWVSAIDTNNWPPEPSRPLVARAVAPPAAPLSEEGQKGKNLFSAKGCMGCHSIGRGRIIGPDLAGVARKYDEAYLANWVRNPEAIYAEKKQKPINPGYSAMPVLGLTQEDAKALAAYLATLK